MRKHLSRHKKKEAALTQSDRTPPKRNHNSWWQGFVIITVFIGLAGRFFYLISRYAVNIFFSDQWDFNTATLFEKHSLWEMFRWQHGPHRQGLGAIISYLVEPHFHWNSRTESFLVGIISVLAGICALWLKRRLFGAFSVSDVCIPLIFFIPSQYETLYMTANLSHGPVPLVLILLYCLSWTIPKPLPRYSFVLLINFLAIYTGFGIFLGIITPMALAADYYLNQRHLNAGKFYLFASMVVSLASLGSFFVQYNFLTAADCSPNLFESPSDCAKFLCLIFANFLGAKGTGDFQIAVGAALVIAMAAALVMIGRSYLRKGQMHGPRNMIAAILILYCFLFSMNTAYGRSCVGLYAAQASRYVIYMGLGLLGLYFYFLTIRKTELGLLLLILLTVSLIGTIPIRDMDEKWMINYSTIKQNWKQCYLDTSDIDQCDQWVGTGVYPDPERTHLKAKLDYLKQTKQNLFSDTP
jgi:hypothetical protein